MKSTPLLLVSRVTIKPRLLRCTAFIAFACCLGLVANAQTKQGSSTKKGSSTKGNATKVATAKATENYTPKTKAALKKSLTKLQYYVTQEAGTEPAFRNTYWNNKKEGVYRCVCCDKELFSSATKYKSGTGWPSFYDPIAKDAVGLSKDWKLIYTRVEVHCKRCKAHLGHVFDDGPRPTGKRYCMNSASLKFVEKKEEEKEEAPAVPAERAAN